MFIHPFIKLQYSMVIVCEVNNFLKVKYRTNRTISGTVKPVLSGHSKIDKTKIVMTKGSLMKVESIAECSPWNILQHF